MSASVRVRLIVALVALAAAGTAVGVTLATRTDVAKQTSKPPPYAADPTARPEIARAVQEALRAWPAGTVRRLRILAERYPRSGLVRLELGLALVLTGQQADATKAWLDAERVQPDSPSAVRAQDLRHPNTPPDLPPFVPSFSQPTSAVQARLLRGAAFQQALRPRLGRTRVRGGSGSRAGRPRGPHGRGRRALRQGPAGPGVFAPRTPGSPVPARADRSLPSRPPPDLLRGRGPGPTGVGPRPLARPRNPARKKGGYASESRSKVLGPVRTKMSRSAYSVRPSQVAQCGIAKAPVLEGGTE